MSMNNAELGLAIAVVVGIIYLMMCISNDFDEFEKYTKDSHEDQS